MTAGSVRLEPFIGRSDEFSELVSAYGAAASGEARVIFVGGEPGIGKTRLLDQFTEHVRAAGGLALRGNCYEDAAARSYAPFVEALRELARVRDAGAPTGNGGRLTANSSMFNRSRLLTLAPPVLLAR